ncbi:hypothetical protein TNCV_1180031 [Trichonephila clavipes]|nr:hypothetical protein TNCV_1180031 [Trichonephila clavipes]
MYVVLGDMKRGFTDLHSNPWSEMPSFGARWRCSQENWRKQHWRSIAFPLSFELSSSVEQFGTSYECRAGRYAPDLRIG